MEKNESMLTLLLILLLQFLLILVSCLLRVQTQLHIWKSSRRAWAGVFENGPEVARCKPHLREWGP